MADVEAEWPLDANANAPRLSVADLPNDEGVKWGVSGLACLSGFSKLVMGSPKPLGIINKSEPKPLLTNAHESGNPANGNAMRGNRLFVPSCEKSIKDKRRVFRWTDKGLSCIVVNDEENDTESNEGVFSPSSSPLSLQP